MFTSFEGCFCRFRLSMTHFVSFKASSVYEPGVLSGVMEGRGTSLLGLPVYIRGSSTAAAHLWSGLIVFPVASSTAEDIFAPKARNSRYRAVRYEIKKAKAEEDKDKEGLLDGNEAEVDDEQVLRCKIILAHH